VYAATIYPTSPEPIVDLYPVDVKPVDLCAVDLKTVFRQSIGMNKREKEPNARALLALNVQRIRIEMGLSQEKLAETVGFHRTYVSQVERCVANPSTDTIQRLAEVLKVPVASLFQLPDSN
jgi:DNA-binding XRE family transcriptional regulator